MVDFAEIASPLLQAEFRHPDGDMAWSIGIKIGNRHHPMPQWHRPAHIVPDQERVKTPMHGKDKKLLDA
ncbi:hypothetical protein AXW83_16035 [Bosea sp. PAMC 26642]|nr:hypothetical protein AXW83_16035 [Bosea sp. PAMC 26642]